MPQIRTHPDQVRQPLPEIPGSVPDLVNRQVGCPFGPRCESASRTCLDMPPTITLGTQRTVKCWLADSSAADTLPPAEVVR